ncbi:hypothetical protein PMM47T1_13990 [Pseudomonas sp. M47T1]|uniref:hypothetical protein n=1 Tax=Pseudomonas sp. M47T1 TaxID=1179778 RepID=UPI000260882A|nr:hypothetical protein [Pseudomonas sp. M47T1]EIK96076.1 hypothetical protein PMM47T1_13990 [Pseudomonas sp. M47T1]
MSDIKLLAYWLIATGVAMNVLIVWTLARLCGRLVYTAVAAASFTRFCWACGRVHGFKENKFPSWVYAPWVWYGFFSVSLWDKPGSINHLGGAGVWKGVGNWTVFPVKEAEPCL